MEMGMPSLNFECIVAQCCCIKRHHRVQPLSPVCPSGGFMIQLNPRRVLRIIRQIPKPTPRKNKFSNVGSVSLASEHLDNKSRHVKISIETHSDDKAGEHCTKVTDTWEKLTQPSSVEETLEVLSLNTIAEQLVASAIFLGFQEYIASTRAHSSQRMQTLHSDDIPFNGDEPLLNISSSGTIQFIDDGITNPAFSETSETCGQWFEQTKNNEEKSLSLPKTTKESSENGHEGGPTQNDDAVIAKYKPWFHSFCECDSITSQSSEKSSSVIVESMSRENLFDNEKPLMFFIHGVGGSANMWHAQMTHFSELGFESIAVDLIGHGFSSMPKSVKEYSFKTILNDLLTIFDRFSKKHNIIIGHSYGCSLAAAMSRERTTKISHLVLISGGGPVSLTPHPGTLSLPACLVACMKPFINCGLQRRALYTPTGRHMLYCSGIELPRYVLQHIKQGQEWPEGDISFYKQIAIPALLIYGMRDPYVTLMEECEMEKTIGRASLELIPDAGHLVMLDAPHNVNILIQRFLSHWAKKK